ncbi:HD domain-containing protein [Asanoa sp. WMMD1127]|nr:HD domain-containing protein [Asanoa sp. WMMD1127]MDG4821912.1 HD domain-containing protein [Asanoa sp. WMMD1127]
MPDGITSLLAAPEVQRLREVRLINTSTPNLAALSDVRRYAHTLGVLALGLRLAPRLRQEHTKEDVETFLAAVVLHDVGSPAFAHLFEYILKSTGGWTHESMLVHIIEGDYRPESIYHQVYHGQGLRLKAILETMQIDPKSVVDMVMGVGPLGRLVAGSVDLDNIDNVYRMSVSLGFQPDIGAATSLAQGLFPDETTLGVSQSALKHLHLWRKWRRKAYEILAFDEPTLQSQAMLTECFTAAIDAGLLGEEHWSLTDEDILKYLAGMRPKVKGVSSIVQRFFVGDFFSTVFVGWYRQPMGDVDLRAPEPRAELRARLEERLRIPCVPYVFYDRGTFEKRLSLRIIGRDGWVPEEIGQTSVSTLAGVFTSRRHVKPVRWMQEKAIEVLEEFGLAPDRRSPIPSKRGVYEIAGQAELPF